MIAVRILREVVGRNAVQSHTLYAGEEFLARELTPFEHRTWRPHFGRVLPRGCKALALFADGDRLSKGEVIVVGVEGVDWEVRGSSHAR